MKKFKLGVLAMALVSMLGFTSCLDGGEVSNIQPVQGFMRISNFMGLYTFSLQTGLTLTPINQSDVTGIDKYSKYAWILATADGDTQDLTSMNWDVNVQGYVMVRDGEIKSQAPVVGDANAPVSEVSYTYYGNEVRIMFYGLNDMFLPIYYRLRDIDADDKDEINAELDKHQFTLYYDSTADFQNGTMTLHLRHNITDLKENDKFMSQSTMTTEHFNIASPLNAYSSIYGGTPNRIIIAYEQNTMNGNYGEGSVSNGQFEINYQTYVDYYNQYIVGDGSDSDAK